jgi:hypothetical protein
MAEYIDYGNPNDELNEVLELSDLEISQKETWSKQLEIFALNSKIRNASEKLSFLIGYFGNLPDKDFESNKIQEIINALN